MTSIAQRVLYIGKEAVPGDGATVDVALRATGSLKAVVDKVVPDEYVGSFAHQRHYIGSKMAEGELSAELYYEHAPYFVSMAIGAGSIAGTAPNAWSFPLPVGTTAPTFATYNCEYGDGDDHIVKAVDVFATGLEISGEAGKSWVAKATLTGGNTTYPSALGATPTPPYPVTPILMASTTLKFADAGDLDAASATGVLISFVYKLEGLQHSKLFAGSLFPSGRGHNKWTATLEIIVEIGNSVIEIQKDKVFNTAQTYIRIGADDADAGGAGVDWKAHIDGTYFLQDVDTLDSRDGNNTIKMVFQGEKEPTVVSPAGIFIDNNLAAL